MMAPTPLETVLLVSGDARVFLAPTRGGMATRFVVGDRHVFFLDESTLLDTSKNVRGGNPILFPSPGKLEGDRFVRDGKTGAMGQHGFARNASWAIVATQADSVTLRIEATDATRAVYPWDCAATYRYRLDGRRLRIEQRFENKGSTPMPFGAGFHPYFHVPQADKAKTRIPTNARRAWDNARKAIVELTTPIDLTAAEVDLHLLDHGSSAARLELAGGHAIDVRASEHFRRWVVWTLGGRDFVCLEPWTSPGNALNTGDDLLVAQPDEAMELWTEIAFV
jgi:galactose mutarotase-like enzyme